MNYIIYVTNTKKVKMQTQEYTGKLKVGDLVCRRIRTPMDVELSESTGKLGIVVSRKMSGMPLHPCVEVWYMKSGKVYSIGESLVEVCHAAA